MSFLSFITKTSKWMKLLLAAVLLAVGWLFLWFFPWHAKLHHIYWLQLSVGLAIFIVPGLCVYGILNDRPHLEFSHITFGFVISHLIFALLGIVGRILHLSFELISSLMMAIGLILLFIYLLPKVGHPIKFKINKERSVYFFSTLPVLVISIFVSLIVIQRVINSDDLTYLAYLTNLQHSTYLGFNDFIFGEDQLISPRFWLISAPFAQAFLAKISNLPEILILGGYYEPFLVILSVLCWYELAIVLKLSPKAASASVVLQLLFLLFLSEYLHPGSPFFNQLTADKATAAFILAPVFLQSLLKLLDRLTWNNIFLFLLAGLSLTLMHPIILAYAVSISGILILLNNSGQGLKNRLIPLIILLVILIPQIVIRFINVPTITPATYDPEVILDQSGSDNLIAQWRNTQYYGFNPKILEMDFPYGENIPLPESILSLGWIIVPILSAIFAIKQRNKSIAQFVLACFALCFLTWFPLTGWIFGYFLNARMLARSVWLFPYGLSAIYMILITRDYLKTRQIAKTSLVRKPFISSNWALAALTIIATGLFLLHMRENNLLDLGKFKSKVQRYQDLAVAGQVLDQQITDQAYVIGSPNLNDLIPGLSAKSNLITFRISSPSNMPYYTQRENDERISDTKRLFSRSAAAKEKMDLLEKYDVHFLFITPFDMRLFDELIETYPSRVSVDEVGGVIIIRIDY